MKKIGICTLYYRNRNYGANLQAYALRTVLEAMGHKCTRGSILKRIIRFAAPLLGLK